MKIETALEKLEEMVEKLEKEDLDLDSATDTYTKAVKLAAQTTQRIHAIENKISLLKKEGENLMLTPL